MCKWHAQNIADKTTRIAVVALRPDLAKVERRVLEMGLEPTISSLGGRRLIH